MLCMLPHCTQRSLALIKKKKIPYFLSQLPKKPTVKILRWEIAEGIKEGSWGNFYALRMGHREIERWRGPCIVWQERAWVFDSRFAFCSTTMWSWASSLASESFHVLTYEVGIIIPTFNGCLWEQKKKKWSNMHTVPIEVLGKLSPDVSYLALPYLANKNTECSTVQYFIWKSYS